MATTPMSQTARIKITRTPARIDKLCVRTSICKDVYGGHEHYCVQEEIDGKPGFVVADIEHTHSNDNGIAMLFAAAPDLLEALQDALESLESFYKVDPASAGQHFGRTLADRMIVAIKKAKRE